jgi:hypothetical protein
MTVGFFTASMAAAMGAFATGYDEQQAWAIRDWLGKTIAVLREQTHKLSAAGPGER